jgi:GGDEF domain-containing protein
MVSGKTLVGVLSLYSSNKDAYSEDHQRILEVVARQVSGAILEAQNAERLRVRSFKDESTGLPNLRHLLEFVEAQLGDDNRRHPFCLMTIQFDPAHGASIESATDAVVSAIRQNLRPADLLFRTGATELTALLLNTEREAGSTVGVRVAAALDALRVGTVLSATQLGLAIAPDDSDEPQGLLATSRERASKGTGPRLIPPEAIH